jgi:GGDEF domain-containing protein
LYRNPEKKGTVAINSFSLDGIDRPANTIKHLSSASIGISLFNKNDEKDIVIDRADRAMYLVKESGKNNITIL